MYDYTLSAVVHGVVFPTTVRWTSVPTAELNSRIFFFSRSRYSFAKYPSLSMPRKDAKNTRMANEYEYLFST